jgi:uncharacterized protein
MKNILSIADLTDVDIGGNFIAGRCGSFVKLLDHLQNLGLEKKLHQVGFKPVIRDHRNSPPDADGPMSRRDHGTAQGETPCVDAGCVFSEREVRQSMVGLRRAALERGFPVEPGIGIHLCTATMGDRSIVVDPKGSLYSCPAFVGREEFRVGHVEDPSHNVRSTNGLWKRCRECVFVPLCGDGCHYASYLRFGDMNRLNCQREFMEYVVRENLKLNYVYSSSMLNSDNVAS